MTFELLFLSFPAQPTLIRKLSTLAETGQECILILETFKSTLSICFERCSLTYLALGSATQRPCRLLLVVAGLPGWTESRTEVWSDIGLYTGLNTNYLYAGWLAPNSASVFVTNHDQERGSTTLTYKSGSNTYILAHVFMLYVDNAQACLKSLYLKLAPGHTPMVPLLFCPATFLTTPTREPRTVVSSAYNYVELLDLLFSSQRMAHVTVRVEWMVGMYCWSWWR
jgi:hypothetical protein